MKITYTVLGDKTQVTTIGDNMAWQGYVGATIQIVPYKEGRFLMWGPVPTVQDPELPYEEILDGIMEVVEEDEGVYVDKWNYIPDFHGIKIN